MEKKSISEIIQILLCLVIFRHVISIFQCFFAISYIPTESIYSIVMSILMIAALVLILFKNKVGVYLFGATQIINVIGLTIINNNFIRHLIVALISCAILFLLLQIRKNGVSAWKVIFGKDNDVESADKASIEKQE